MKRLIKQIIVCFFLVFTFSCCTQMENEPIFYAIEQEQPN